MAPHPSGSSPWWAYFLMDPEERFLYQIREAMWRRELREQELALLRDRLFRLRQAVRDLEERLPTDPLGAAVGGRYLQHRLAESSLSESFFPDLQDKEFLAETARRLRDLVEAAWERLSPPERRDGERALHYLVEMSLLRRALADRAARRELAETEGAWRKVQGRFTLWTGLSASGCLLGAYLFPFLAFFSCVLLLAIAQTLPSPWNGIVLGGLALLVLLLVGGLLASALQALRLAPEHRALKERREDLKALLLPAEALREARERFGTLEEGKLLELYQERTRFLRQLLGIAIPPLEGAFGD